jgi:hypothetical protein
MRRAPAGSAARGARRRSYWTVSDPTMLGWMLQ